ncbi:alpha-L-rhamnosidase [Humibacter ginsenosidimutans]|uniref:alpha-L-rhamnosidase n=1 Tax=Humibacter ginsenosidimutans TaxID=2599293 RepID=A0A5B8M6V3_9MICO|nr:alpha-L-rhamnosidase [Humibacter ginsenosidimutans]QDZ15714.1 Bacterial alpha-L-rhamnosidase [Humibacter ginsenosidimutans]
MAHLDRLRVDHLDRPMAIARCSPAFFWHVVADDADDASTLGQAGYRIRILEAANGRVAGEPVADTDWIDAADSVAVSVPGFVGEPGTEYTWELAVRLAGDEREVRASGKFGIGLDTWDAPWFEPRQEPVLVEGPMTLGPDSFAPAAGAPAPSERLHPPRFLRQEFTITEAPVAARLRISSQGVNCSSLNGVPASDELFEPGYESYQHSISVHTHDVTSLVHAGSNALGVILGDGWYAGRISILGRSAQYGRILRATWRLELTFADDSRTVITPDETVLSSRGPIDWSDIFIGERYDARREIPGWDSPGFDAAGWEPGTVVVAGAPEVAMPLVPFIGEPVRRVRELTVADILSTPSGETVLDFGQVVAGRVRMTVRGAAGTVVRLEHAEVVDADGNFLDNILGVNKDQADEYVLAGHASGETWEPLFTFHGFRYVKLIGYPGTPLAEDFVAIVIANDLEQTASFASSNARLDRLVENTLWSQRSNFLAVPTDCPQRERAGWTGDLQIFAPTASTLMGVASFLDRWLANLRADQSAHDGVVPIIVPMPPAMDDPVAVDEGLSGIRAAAGWGDAVTIAPWALYRHYGDLRFLADNVGAMRDWVDHQTQSAADVLPPRLRDTDLSDEQRGHHELLWNGPFNFGDWLAPSTLGDGDDELDAMMNAPRLTAELTGPLFQLLSLDLLASAEDELGDTAAAETRRRQAAAVRAAFAAEYVDADGFIAPNMQGIYVLALAFDAVPAGRRDLVIGRLVELIHEAGDHLDTGFVSVPYLLDVLWENGHADLARTLLMQDTAPSWLYEVDHGATTIWEAWHAVHEDGTVDRVSMNHYAFGCVVDWMMRRLAGIDLVEPGYRRSRIAPDLDGVLDSCSAHVDTPYGRLAVDWSRDADAATLRVTVPVGIHADLVLPAGWSSTAPATLEAGVHALSADRVA